MALVLLSVVTNVQVFVPHHAVQGAVLLFGALFGFGVGALLLRLNNARVEKYDTVAAGRNEQTLAEAGSLRSAYRASHDQLLASRDWLGNHVHGWFSPDHLHPPSFDCFMSATRNLKADSFKGLKEIGRAHV